MPFYSLTSGGSLVEAATFAALPATGAASTLYVVTGTNTLYRWSGSAYVEVSASPAEVIEAANLAAFPGTGAAGKIYVALDTGKAYRWGGSSYVEISGSDWATITGKPSTFAPSAHASSHATGGADAITPASIGAAASSHTHNVSQIYTAGNASLDELETFIDQCAFGGYSSALVNVLGGVANDDSRLSDPRPPNPHGATHSPGGADPVTLVESFLFTRSSKPASASGSAGSYTWSVPATAKFITLDVTGGGGGGGSGRRGAAGTVRGGGGGGGSGGRTVYQFPVSELSTLGLTVSVGAGGAGGAAVSANDTNGNAGGAGGPSQVQITATSDILAYGFHGTGGGAGTTSGGGGGSASWVSTFTGISGGTGGGSTPAGGTPGFGVQGAQGGAGGGGISAADTAGAGGAGYGREVSRNLNANPAGGAAGGGAGGAGVNAPAGGSGGGGSGGGASTTTAGGSGGNGGAYGGGGGGGGAALNGFASGAGGNGGEGVIRIIVWY